ncbi:MAG: hypothetical protein GTO42_01220 [Candidatus Latescibacteria bacterium]|nr:hypothetical protein [Candidatus Latescibacterota bacterium]NIO27150.1 hypothetical protein [Candidatus Latescibacterota bacterium]NIO54674.1 hypothetical protein [Candidatus Latescibacterota bacterium]NIT00757.1 hypothetical protein [Candidatus Latescibacterota bacterium]NIT37680.1 hypothetical protein [Candidatus Latescibacterota bacterium]
MMRTRLLFIIFTLWCGVTLGAVGSRTDCGCLQSLPPGNHVVLICPQGDGPTLAEAGAIITLTYQDIVKPERPFSTGGCNGGIVWCGGPLRADSFTGDNGQTTVSGPMAGGGYDTEIVWYLVHLVNQDCMMSYVPLVLVSPDINADLAVDLVDFSIFAAGFPSPSKPYDPRLDFDGDGSVDIVDFSLFAQHWLHRCS